MCHKLEEKVCQTEFQPGNVNWQEGIRQVGMGPQLHHESPEWPNVFIHAIADRLAHDLKLEGRTMPVCLQRRSAV